MTALAAWWHHHAMRGAAGLVLLLVGCGADDVAGPYAGHDSAVYRDVAHWLCHPDQASADNVCARALDTSVVAPDGSVTVEPFVPAPAPEVDCFYVYPTTSTDDDDLSDRIVAEEERFIVQNQAARFGAVCRVFAPIYRQVTIAALLGLTDFSMVDFTTPYADVLDAFQHYVANHNDGRGMILIGHSQGSRLLRRLVAEEIEPRPELAARLVSAHLIGSVVEVPNGEDVGGAFVSTPLCRADDQTGCVVSYSSYRATAPPEPATALYGSTGDAATLAGCVHPGALGGGSAPLDMVFPVAGEGLYSGFLNKPGAFADPTLHDPLTTPFFSLPGLVHGQCVDRDGHQFLEITIASDVDDPRADDVGGDLSEGWGLHLADMHLALGNLVELAGRQAAAWRSRGSR